MLSKGSVRTGAGAAAPAPSRAAARLAALACLALLALAAVPAARAADSIYWSNFGDNTLRAGNLDGSGAASNLFAGEAIPAGVAIDPSANRIYWANQGNGTIRTANLDGSGASNLFTGEISPEGVAIDPSANRIYWANTGFGTIRAGNLDGSGASDLFTGESAPRGVAIDPAANRIYWANSGAGAIRVANLDGTGAASNLFVGENGPTGVAIDPAGNRIYWASHGDGAIRVGNLDGSGAEDLVAGDAPRGVAIDPAANRIYWVNFAGTQAIRVANLDGSSVSDLFVAESNPHYAALLRAPLGAGAPQISGTAELGQQLSCGQGAWAPDLLGAFLYRAPSDFAYQWSLGGSAIGGATASTHTPTALGNYACEVTASNHAGSASQTSAAVTVERATPSLAGQAGAATLGQPLSDVVTLSGGFNAGGQVVFTAYAPGDPTCASPVYTSAPVTVAGDGDYASSPAFVPTETGTYGWIASYSGDAANASVATACGDPGQSSLVSAAPSSPPSEPVVDRSAECAKLQRLLAKRKRQLHGLSHRARSARKRALIKRNIADTKRRMAGLGC